MAKLTVTAIVRDEKGITLSNPENPYRRGTAKRTVFAWCLSQGTFTKSEFLAAVAEMKTNGDVESKMEPVTCARAWWGEFYSKYKVLIPVDDEVISTES